MIWESIGKQEVFGLSPEHCSQYYRRGAEKGDHITPILKHLHWLPVSCRIEFKVLFSQLA